MSATTVSPLPAPDAQPTTPVFRVAGLRLAYPGQPPLFEDLSFALGHGLTHLTADVGKTTLLRLLAGELPADGHGFLAGRPWQAGAPDPGVFWLDPRASAWDTLTPDAVAEQVQARHPGFDLAAWQCHQQAFGLAEHAHKTMHMLSTGSRRKVALAAALAAGAALSLLDEPTAGLDQPSVAYLAEALNAEAARPGRAWLIAAAWGLEERLAWTATLALDAPAAAG